MSTAIQKERQEKIVNQLKSENFMSTTDISELLNYSESTIKRDLVELENTGLIRRTRGGAVIIDRQKIDIPYLMKVDKFNEEKEKEQMAKVAQSLIKDDMVLYIDSSSTALHLVHQLHRFEGIKVITNGVITASLLSEYTNANVSVLGGSIVPKRFTINGSRAYNDALSYNVDLAFLSCRGFDFSFGASEINEDEAMIKQAFRKTSRELVLMVTEDKFNQRYLNQSVSCGDIDYMITDKPLPEKDEKKIAQYNISLLY